MSTILLIHGPNLNKLGLRDRTQYGAMTLQDIEALVRSEAEKRGLQVASMQSNHEGEIIDYLQERSIAAAGIIINPGALTHYGYSLYDALVDTKLPVVEVHLSDIKNREPWRALSVIAPACIAQIMGKKELGYQEAVEVLHEHLKK